MINQTYHFSCFILGSKLLKKVDFSVEMGNFNLLLDFFEKTCPSMPHFPILLPGKML